MAYTTVADLKAYLDISVTTDDTLLTACITRAQAMLEARIGRVFEAATATNYFHVEDIDGKELWLGSYDLLTVTTLTNGNGVVIDAANFRLEPRNFTPKFLIKLDSAYSWEFTDGDSEISVAGTWGYSATAPGDIVQACIRLSSYLYRQKGSNSDFDRPIVTGDGVTIMPSDIPRDIFKTVDHYIRRI